MKSLRVPLKFHFVLDKNYGTIDEGLATMTQFDNVLISFVDEKGILHYMPILEPYSNLGDVRLKFQDTKCFTITQALDGKKTFSFDKIPRLDENNRISKYFDINLKAVKDDTIFLEIKESWHITGDPWFGIRPYMLDMLKDSLKAEEDIRTLSKYLIETREQIDSTYGISYTDDSSGFSLSYEYLMTHRISKASDIIHFQPEMFIINEYYTPFSERDQRSSPGYLFEEPHLSYTLTFNLNNKFIWIKNQLVKDVIENSIGKINSDYDQDESTLSVSFSFDYKKDQFNKTEWPQMLELRDRSYTFLSRNLYFKNVHGNKY